MGIDPSLVLGTRQTSTKQSVYDSVGPQKDGIFSHEHEGLLLWFMKVSNCLHCVIYHMPHGGWPGFIDNKMLILKQLELLLNFWEVKGFHTQNFTLSLVIVLGELIRMPMKITIPTQILCNSLMQITAKEMYVYGAFNYISYAKKITRQTFPRFKVPNSICSGVTEGTTDVLDP